MRCDYFDAGVCRSCTLMGVPHATQLTGLQTRVAEVLADHVPHDRWSPPYANPAADTGFRNKAKLVAGGTKEAPTLGILDDQRRGVDLRHCGILEPTLRDCVVALAELLPTSGLTPYDVPSRNGELKAVLLTLSPDAELMARFVLRSPGQRRRVLELLEPLRRAVAAAGAQLRVATINLQPEHKAVLEGPEEEVLTAETTLPMRLDGVTLHLGPRSFFQTSTPVAAALYRQVTDWIGALDPRPTTVWDLYCGVGGFGLHCAATGLEVHGVEASATAVASARRSAQDLDGRGPAAPTSTWHAGDATVWARTELARGACPDVVVVNPPRRGIGPELAELLDRAPAEAVVYSSCHAESLAADLARMGSWQVEAARLFEMFPQTRHGEVAVLLRRR